MAVAGWYADPYGAQGQLRYWDGAQWTANVMPRPSSGPVQGAASGPVGAQAQAAQAAQMPAQAMHESIPLGASTTAAPASGAYNYQGQVAEQAYAAQAQAQGQVQAQPQTQANPYANPAQAQAQNQGYAQMANAYEAAAQGYAQAATAYDAAAQGYAQVGQYETAQGYGQYDPNAQAYGQVGASPYYQGYDPYGQMGQAQAYQAPEGSNRTLRLIAFVLYIVAILGVVALTVVVALSFFGILSMSTSYTAGFDLFSASTPLVFLVALPLAWLIPMCIHTLGILKGKKRNTVLFGVLSLLFCGFLPGLFLLIAKKDPKQPEAQQYAQPYAQPEAQQYAQQPVQPYIQ